MKTATETALTEHEHAAGGVLLREVAESLFGAESAAAVAAPLGVNRRTVQRWLNGQNEVPLEVWRELAEMLALRASEVAELRREVEELRREVEETIAAACAAAGPSTGAQERPVEREEE
jgi:predicted transcriptional regulator